MTDIWRVALALLALLLAGAVSAPAAAHLTPNSEIRLRFEPGAVRADVLIPLAEYAYAVDGPRDPGSLALYLARHTRAATPDGTPWAVEVGAVRVESAPGGPDILATITLRPPPGAPDRQLTLRWDAVIAEADSHFALVMVEGDLARGKAHDDDLIGTFTAGQRSLSIDRGAAGHGALFAGALRIGARHILEGHDHLLFLLVLLLPAPLFAAPKDSGAKWTTPRPARATVRHLAWVVTAFTLGHSATLIAAALLNAQLPSAPVEALIAASVLVSAIHAMRPVFPGRESWVAFGFGLAHGLAFATVVAGFGASLTSRGTAILGFNLGIEAVQLALVLLLLPGLLLAARTPWFARLRLALAGLAAFAALIWLVERVLGIESALGTGVAALLPPLGLILVALSLAAGAWWLARFKLPMKPIGRSGPA